MQETVVQLPQVDRKHGGVDDTEALDDHQSVPVIGERVRDLRGRVVLVDADPEPNRGFRNHGKNEEDSCQPRIPLPARCGPRGWP